MIHVLPTSLVVKGEFVTVVPKDEKRFLSVIDKLQDALIEFMKAKLLNRTQIINDAVIKHLKANYEY